MKRIYGVVVKKVFLSFSVGCLSVLSMATNYYISNNGNDANSGRSANLSWKTLTKINTIKFQPGDSILLKRGDTWRETITLPSSGNSTNSITISNYGTGSNPKILGSRQPTSWTNQGGNIWKSDTNFTVNPYTNGGNGGGNIWIINNDLSVSTGIYKTSLGALTADNMWYYGSNSIYIYSTSNPATRYNSIEVQQRGGLIVLNSKNYITIDGVDLFYGGSMIYGGYPTGNNYGLIVRNCEMAYSGYPDGNSSSIMACYNNMLVENNIIHDQGRRGISLTNAASNNKISNITIRNNSFYHGYHTTSVDLQLSDGYTGSIDSVFIYGNIIADDVDRVSPYMSTMQMFISDQSSTGTITHVYVYNNVFKGTMSVAINIGGAEDVKVWNNTFYGFNTVMTSDRQFLFIGDSKVDIKNNIFYSQLTSSNDNKGIIMLTSGGTITSDYNCIYRTSKTARIYHAIGFGDYTNADSAAIRSVLDWDVHSKFKDPLVNSDLTLQSTSPCKQAGVNVGLSYSGSKPDLGAYQTNKSVSNLTEISSFTLPGQIGSSVINSSTRTIGISMPYGISVTNLAATYTLSAGATVKVGTLAQVSGTTRNNFTNPLVYAVTAQDEATTKNWTVSVTVSPNNQNDITSFTLPGQTGSSVINSTSRTISITMPYSTSLTNLVANYTLSTGASAKVGMIVQVSGATVNNFASQVVYTVIAQDGLSSKNWTIVVQSLNNSYGLSNPSICKGSSAIIKQDGSQSGISYQLQSNGINNGSPVIGTGSPIQFVVSPASTTNYNVVASNTNLGSSITLTNMSTVTVTQIPAAPVTPSGTETVTIPTKNSYTYSVTSVKYADNYTWSISPSNAGSILGNSNSATVSWNDNYIGNAYIMVMASNLCGTSSSLQALKISMTKSSISTDIENPVSNDKNDQTFEVYPNPSRGNFTVLFSNLPAAGSRIDVFDLNGKIIVSRVITSSTEEFDLSGKGSGLYIVKSTVDSAKTSRKLIIQN